MCGINGFNFSDEHLVKRMNAKIKHRGPDGDGVFVCENVSLGHTRLAIIDLSDRASQPMFSSDDSIILVFNGEIYNFQDIKKELEEKGYKFSSDSDSEVIISAYQEYGMDCLQKFNGIFAFAIYDRKKDLLFLARDRIGVKPLYYYWDNNKFIFSSEIKAILEHPIERKVDKGALNMYFRMLYVPAPLTMFDKINKLEPGSYLVYKKGSLEKKKYWQPNDFQDLKDRDQAIAEIKKLMKDSVRLQLISDRPVGVFLSGGIDSTIITGLISEITNSKIKTFSANFDIDNEKFNRDAELAKKTSQHYDTDHSELLISGKDAVENIFDVIYSMDEPVSNTTQIATYLLSKHASKEVAVVLGGDGGDELFGGYERYRLSSLISQYQGMPVILKNTFGEVFIKMLRHKNPSVSKLNLLPNVERYLSFMAQKEKDINRFLNTRYNEARITEEFYRENYFEDQSRFAKVPRDFEKQFMWADTRSWLPDESLIRSDKMSMAFGLEQRVPILDHRLVELSLKIPTKWKIKGKDKKLIFKEAFKEYIPDYVLNQPKRGWFSPTSIWMRGPLKKIVYEVLTPEYSPGTNEFFDFQEIKKMLDEHVEGRVYHMNLLWSLVTFQIWHKQFIK